MCVRDSEVDHSTLLYLLCPNRKRRHNRKEVIKGEVQPLDQLPHCHDVDGIVKVCIILYIYIYVYACACCLCVCIGEVEAICT